MLVITVIAAIFTKKSGDISQNATASGIEKLRFSLS